MNFQDSELHEFVENASDLMQSVTPDGRYVYVNKAWRETLGYTADEVAELNMALVIEGSELSHCMTILGDVLEGRDVGSIQTTFVAKDGTKIEVEGAITCRFDGDTPTYTRGIFRNVTERRREELEATRFFDMAYDMLCVANFEGYFQRVNPAFERVLGYTLEELTAVQFLEFVHPDDQEATLAEVAKLAEGATTFSFINRYRSKNGEYRWFHWNGVPAVKEGRIYAAARDITDLKHAQEALTNSESRLRTILDNTVDGIITMDYTKTVLTFNPAAEAMFGYSVEEVVGKNIKMLMPEPYHSEHDGYVDNYLETKDAKVIGVGREVPGLRKDGTEFPLDLAVSETRHLGSTLFTGIVRDATERKRAEAQIMSLARFPDENPNPVIRVLKDGRRLYANSAGDDLFSDPVEDGCLRVVLDVLRTGNSRTEEIENGDKVYMCVFAPVVDSDYVNIYGLDITELKQVEHMKDEFISMVSHELRTPLASIKGYVDLILEGETGEIEPIQEEFLGIVRKNTDRLVMLINDLLDISRIESGRFEMKVEPMDLAVVMADCQTSISPQLTEKDMALKIDIEPGLPVVLGDRDRTVQIIGNLLSNAYKYTPEGGRISVTVSLVENMVQVDVSDTGIGMTDEEREKLFTRFFRYSHLVAQEAGGTGLGLAITRSLVEMQGGKIWVTSTPGEGSTFSFDIPTTYVALPDDGRPMKTGRLPEGATVLVVEDEKDIASLIRRYLERAGLEVLVAGTASEALQIARSEKPDLITLDIMLPDADGITALEWMKSDKETGDIPVMMLSILPDDGRGKLAGAVDYLIKPVQEDVLIARVSKMFEDHSQPKVLVVDDEPDVRRVMTVRLEAAGYPVFQAANGREAIEVAARELPDLVFLDIKMPDIDGVEVLRTLRQRKETRDLRVVMMTASPGMLESSRPEAESLGASACIDKPVTGEELGRALAEWLEQKDQT